MPPRKITDVYKSIDHLRPIDMVPKLWNQSFEGVNSALESIGLKMITTRAEFEAYQEDINGKKCYSHRRVIVSKNGILSKPTTISDLLTGSTGLLTNEEKNKSKEEMITKMKEMRPKGSPINNTAESNAIDEFNILLKLDDILCFQHLTEHRLADIAYKFVNKDDNAYVAIQVKSCTLSADNTKDLRLGFCHGESYMTIESMKNILLKNTGILCIGRDHNKIDVVWFFHDNRALNLLNSYENKMQFRPVPHPTRKSTNGFTNAYNSKDFRFDIGSSKTECERLRNEIITVVNDGDKHNLEFYNEDDSQIPSDSHKIEQDSFAMIRAACQTIDVVIKRIHEDAYGPVDFRINDVIRIQDKVAGKMIKFRRANGYPYNPDTIDAIQYTTIETKIVYLLPMRMKKNEEIVSFFTEYNLMHQGLSYSNTWRDDHKEYKYDLNSKEGIEAYVNACKAAHEVPKLTDQNFYKNLIEKNADKFGSKKKMADNK